MLGQTFSIMYDFYWSFIIAAVFFNSFGAFSFAGSLTENEQDLEKKMLNKGLIRFFLSVKKPEIYAKKVNFQQAVYDFNFDGNDEVGEDEKKRG